MSGKSFKSVAIFIVFLAFAGCLFYYANVLQARDLDESTQTKSLLNEAYLTSNDNVVTLAENDVVKDTDVIKPALDGLDIEEILSERGMGNTDASVKIREFSSLTCGHCGSFHKNAFKQIKSDYIDTGKIYLIFDDFPLNLPALDASIIARCLPETRYFDFLQLLFETQDKWAYSPNYKTYLKQNAQLAGMSAERFDACINSEELKKGLADKRGAVQKKHEINSTPSFVVNEEIKLGGSLPFERFKEVIEKELAKSK